MNEVHKWDDPTDALLSLVLLFLLFYLLYHDVFPCQGAKIHLVFFFNQYDREQSPTYILYGFEYFQRIGS